MVPLGPGGRAGSRAGLGLCPRWVRMPRVRRPRHSHEEVRFPTGGCLSMCKTKSKSPHSPEIQDALYFCLLPLPLGSSWIKGS